MAALHYKDDHNKVCSDSFPPIVYDSLVRQFWALATVRTLEDGSQEIVATVDGNETNDPTLKAIGRFSSKLFANMKLKFDGEHMPLLAAMLPGDHADAGAVIAAGDIPPLPPPDNVGAGATIAAGGTSPPPFIFHETESEPSIFVEDDNVGGDFHFSPNRSNEAPPYPGQPAGGAEEHAALTTLSFKLNRCIEKVEALETELKETKKTLRGAVLTLIGRVKHLEVQLQKSKRKVVLSDSEEEGEPFDMEALHVLENVFLESASIVEVEAAVSLSQASKDAPTQAFFTRRRPTRRLRKLSDAPAFDKFKANIPADVSAGSGTDAAGIPTAPIPAISSAIPAGSSIPTAAQSNKGKEPLMEDLSMEQERHYKNIEDARIGEELAKKIQAKEEAQLDKQRAELTEQRQKEVHTSAMFYTEDDWINIMAQVATNSSLSKDLLGTDVTEENFPERMAALMKRKRQALAE
ncbi:hypothetical protein Tco_1516992 [Tanacetum coccineum]